MSKTQIVLAILRFLFLGSLALTLLVMAFIELFAGEFTTFVLYMILHAIYGHVVLVKQVEILSEVADQS